MKQDNSVKICPIVPKIELDFDIFMINMYIYFITVWATSAKKMSVHSCSVVPKIELNFDILMINLHTKFYFSMSNFSLRHNVLWVGHILRTKINFWKKEKKTPVDILIFSCTWKSNKIQLANSKGMLPTKRSKW